MRRSSLPGMSPQTFKPVWFDAPAALSQVSIDHWVNGHQGECEIMALLVHILYPRYWLCKRLISMAQLESDRNRNLVFAIHSRNSTWYSNLALPLGSQGLCPLSPSAVFAVQLSLLRLTRPRDAAIHHQCLVAYRYKSASDQNDLLQFVSSEAVGGPIAFRYDPLELTLGQQLRL
nr:hypothetical protein Iba_chr01aCG7050 [Ipomoea batatas]